MNKNSILRILLPAIMAFAVTTQVLAVTDNEMEQARTIAAQAYLRYANNGSGYLDDVKATNIADLQKELKAKEQENIKAFLAIPVPKDYAQWDKAKLAEYWSVTALNTPGLIDQGKGAKSRIRSRINSMSVSDPVAQPAAVPDAAAATAPEQTPSVLTDSVPQDILSQEQDILADQKAIEADSQTPSMESSSNSTWIYVVILIILIAVVVWLVIYAAKVMKNQQGDGHGDSNDSEELNDMRERAKRAIAQYKEKLQELNEQLQESDSKLAEAQEETRRYKEDNRRLNERIADLQAKLRAAAAAPAPRQQPQPQSRPQARPAQEKDSDDILHVIYLGRANSRGIFVRADRNYSNGNSVYKLDTEDGLTGTFEYVDNTSMNRTVLDRPKEMLSGGCTADDIEDTLGATEIVTESRGTAIFENGYWKVLRKSRIRFK